MMNQLCEQKINLVSDLKYGSVDSKSNKVMIRVKNIVKKEVSSIATFSALILAIVLGLIIQTTTGKWSERSLMYLSFPGQVVLQMLKILIIPLVVSSLVSALGNINNKLSSRIGWRVLLYYFTTTVMAVTLGLFSFSFLVRKRILFSKMFSKFRDYFGSHRKTG